MHVWHSSSPLHALALIDLAPAQVIAMSSPGLFKTQLCYHVDKKGHDRASCSYAHSLSEVRPPDQRLCSCSAWRNCHYYVGQTWSQGVSGLFLWYVEHSPIVEFPQWALAAYWFYKPEDVAWMPFAGYDFGISER